MLLSAPQDIEGSWTHGQSTPWDLRADPGRSSCSPGPRMCHPTASESTSPIVARPSFPPAPHQSNLGVVGKTNWTACERMSADGDRWAARTYLCNGTLKAMLPGNSLTPQSGNCEPCIFYRARRQQAPFAPDNPWQLQVQVVIRTVWSATMGMLTPQSRVGTLGSPLYATWDCSCSHLAAREF